MIKFPRTFPLLVLVISILVACSPANASVLAANPYAPKLGDGLLNRDTLEIVKMELIRSSALPATTTLELSYFLPTPCHQLRVVASSPDSSQRINLEAYSLVKPNQPCAMMRLATPTVIDLAFASLPNGKYTVWVNGTMAGEVTEP